MTLLSRFKKFNPKIAGIDPRVFIPPRGVLPLSPLEYARCVSADMASDDCQTGLFTNTPRSLATGKKPVNFRTGPLFASLH